MSYDLGDLVQSILRPVFAKKPQLSLMMDWPMIVGSELASYTWPLKIVSPQNGPGVAYIHSPPAYAIVAWSHTGVMIERINQYLGYQAISRIRLVKDDVAKTGS